MRNARKLSLSEAALITRSNKKYKIFREDEIGDLPDDSVFVQVDGSPEVTVTDGAVVLGPFDSPEDAATVVTGDPEDADQLQIMVPDENGDLTPVDGTDDSGDDNVDVGVDTPVGGDDVTVVDPDDIDSTFESLVARRRRNF